MKTVDQKKKFFGISNLIVNLLIISICLLLLISSKQLPFSIYIPSMPFLDTLAFFVPLIICTILLVINNNFKIDYIALLLFSRIIFSFLTIIFNNVNVYSGLKSISIFGSAFLAYTIWRNIAKKIDGNRFKLFINVFMLILSIQTLGIFFLNYLSASVVLKNTIEVPIGNSNFIAANLLVCIVYLIFDYKKSTFDNLLIFFGLVSMVLTFSFGAIISLLIVFFIKYIIIQKNNNIIKQMIVIIILISLAIFSYQFIINYSPSQDKFLNDIIRNTSIKLRHLQDGNFERLFSGRFELFDITIDNFKNNPIFGSYYGVEFNGQSDFKAHNLFLEALSSYGLLGFFTLVYSLLIVLIKMISNIRNNGLLIVPIFLALISGIIHGLVEPNFFTLSFEFIWWSFAGFGMGKIQERKYKKYKSINVFDRRNM